MAAKQSLKTGNSNSKLSEGTLKVISELTSSANLTPFQKKQLFSAVSAGSPLPLYLPAHHPSTLKRKRQKHRVPPSTHSRRKPKEAILQEGAYERPKYQPPPEPIPSYEESKSKLQHAMENAENSLPAEAQQPCRAHISPVQPPQKVPVANTLVDQLLQEIEERERFLEDMRKLGQATKYEKSVKAEIALRMKELERLQAQNRQQ